MNLTTLSITSESEICIDEKCSQAHFSEISLGSGSVAYFIDLGGIQTSYKFTQIVTHSLYKPIYCTCNTKIILNCVYQCTAVGQCITRKFNPGSKVVYDGPLSTNNFSLFKYPGCLLQGTRARVTVDWTSGVDVAGL